MIEKAADYSKQLQESHTGNRGSCLQTSVRKRVLSGEDSSTKYSPNVLGSMESKAP